ncbi:MAG: PAS domain S-box protein [Spirulina sp.]
MGLTKPASPDLHSMGELSTRIINTSLDGIAAISPVRDSTGEIVDFCWLMLNPTATRLLGCPSERLLGLHFQNSPREFPLVRSFTARVGDFKSVISKGQPLEVEIAIETDLDESQPDNPPSKWFYLAITKLEDRCVLTFRDITIPKAREERLNLLERAIEVSPNGMIIADARSPHYPITDLNSSFERMTGSSREEMQGQDFPFLQGEDREQPGLQELQQALKEERECQVVLSNVRRDGKSGWHELTMTPVGDPQGRIAYYIGWQTDISDRLLAETQLRQVNERLRTLFTSSATIIYSCKLFSMNNEQLSMNNEGNEGINQPLILEHTWVSENVAEILGYEGEDYVGDRDFWWHRIHPLDSDRVLQELSRLLSTGRSACEYRFRHGDGSYRWIYDELRLLYNDALETPEAVGYWLDITQRKRAELQLAASELSLTHLLENEKQYTQQLDRKNQQLQAEIRDRVRAEESLQTSQQRLSFFFQQMPLAAIEWDRDRQIVAWNPGAEAIFGYSAREIVGHPCDRIVPDRANERVQQTFTDLLANCGGHYDINENITKAGKNIVCEWYNTPLIDEKGTVIGIASIATDITERQHRELLESTQNMVLRMLARGRALVDVLAMFVTQIDGLMPNLTTAIMFLSDDGTYLHSCISAQLPPEYLQAIDPFPLRPDAGCFGTAARSGKRVIVEDIETESCPGNILPEGYRACWSQPMTSDTGKVLGIVAFYFTETRSPDPQEINIVESIGRLAALIIVRKRSEVALQKSGERYERATRAAGVGVWECNLQNGDLYIDPTIKDVLGYRDEEFINDPEVWIEHIHPDDRASSKAAMTAYFAGENPEYIDEYRMVHKDGSIRWILCRGRAIGDEQGNALQMVGTHTDISDRKRTEMALQQAKEEAERANRAKSDFLASMSHELRTPLNAVLGFTQLLAQESSLNSEQKEYLNIINRSGAHLLTLINDILSMSKIEAGRVSLNEEECDLYYFLESIRDMFAIKAQTKNIELIVKYTADVPQYVRVDEGKLRQILINLIGNGIKFTDKGFVELSVTINNQQQITNNQQQITNNQQQICFQVQDTGCGIVEEDLEVLFNPFEQAETQRHKIEGTGLGLPISREFVRLMGGDIAVKSDRDRGSIFAFEIPVGLVEETDLIPEPQPAIAVRRETLSATLKESESYRILIVEDISESCELLIQLLQNVGFLVRTAENGADAIELWQTWQPHLILMDIWMPVMDGCEATRQIRDREGKSESSPIPIIAITASVFEEDRVAILAAGCDDIISKPLEEKILWEKLAFYLQFPQADSTISDREEREVTISSTPASIAPSLHQEQLQIMSAEWQEEFARASLEIDYEKMQELVEQIPDTESELADCLNQLIEDYRVDIILEWLQPETL